MRKRYAIILSFLVTTCVFAQSPQKMSYQAVIRDADNNLVTSHDVGMQISILQGSSSGTPVYVETQTPTTNANGLVTIEIGGGTAVMGTFKGVDWSIGSYFIKTEIDLSGGTNYTVIATSQILSVPYALYAKTSENVINVTISFIGDTLYLGNNKIIIPGISVANQLKDTDGNIYKVIRIGNQLWMAENLKTTKLNDGTLIPNVIDDGEWYNLVTPGYAWYNHDPDTYKNVYGALYNWYTASTGKLCPQGWHIPSDDEWSVLIGYLGDNVANKLKETGTIHWVSPNSDATNESGFTGLPGGWRFNGGGFNGLNYYCRFWTSTEFSSTIAYARLLDYGNPDCYRNNEDKVTGFSVRCVKNN
jgi:uncharacterized protein (TIGR02145 family)